MKFLSPTNSSIRSVINLAQSDIAANPHDPKAQLALSLFRLAHWARTGSRRKVLLLCPIVVIYRIAVEWVLGIELRPKTKVGPGLRLYHGVGLVINDGAILGRNVTVRHGVTIGSAQHGGPSPNVGDDVEIGAGAILLGNITIGRGASIGAGAVVLRDVPAGCVARGNPARIFRGKEQIYPAIDRSENHT